MLIRVSYLLLIVAIAIAAFLFLRVSRDDADASPTFTGVDRCAVCHTSVNAGRQFDIWRNSAHANAFRTLRSDSAVQYIRSHGDSVASCMTCHTTIGREAFVDTERHLVEEGVGCERCHGAGSRYSYFDVMRDRAAFKTNGGVVGVLDDCHQCHAPDPATSDRHCPFQTSAFNADSAWIRIHHPVSDRVGTPDTVPELRP